MGNLESQTTTLTNAAETHATLGKTGRTRKKSHRSIMQYGFKGGILRIKSTVYLKIFHVRQQTESYQGRKLKNACVCG